MHDIRLLAQVRCPELQPIAENIRFAVHVRAFPADDLCGIFGRRIRMGQEDHLMAYLCIFRDQSVDDPLDAAVLGGGDGEEGVGGEEEFQE